MLSTTLAAPQREEAALARRGLGSLSLEFGRERENFENMGTRARVKPRVVTQFFLLLLVPSSRILA